VHFVRIAQLPIAVVMIAFGVYYMATGKQLWGLLLIVISVAGATLALTQLRRGKGTLNRVGKPPDDIEERLKSSGWWANLLAGAFVTLGAAGVGAYMVATANSKQNVIAGMLLLAAGSIVIGWLTYWMAPILWRLARGRSINPPD
jgi:hypothetical protein